MGARLKEKGWKKIYQQNTNRKLVDDILISNKIDFKAKMTY